MAFKRDIHFRVFMEQRLEIDGRRFHGCSFSNCTLIFGGKQLPYFAPDCEFKGVSFELVHGAETVVQFLQTLNASGLSALTDTILASTPSR